MMWKEKVFWSSIVGFFVVSLLGMAAHYWYDLSGQNPVVGFFAPVNESVGEHLKLLFYPYVLYVLVEYLIYGRKQKDFLFSRGLGLVCGLLSIPLIYFSYTLLTGKSILAVDIMIFFFAVGLAFYLSARRLLKR